MSANTIAASDTKEQNRVYAIYMNAVNCVAADTNETVGRIVHSIDHDNEVDAIIAETCEYEPIDVRTFGIVRWRSENVS